MGEWGSAWMATSSGSALGAGPALSPSHSPGWYGGGGELPEGRGARWGVSKESPMGPPLLRSA